MVRRMVGVRRGLPSSWTCDVLIVFPVSITYGTESHLDELNAGRAIRDLSEPPRLSSLTGIRACASGNTLRAAAHLQTFHFQHLFT